MKYEDLLDESFNNNISVIERYNFKSNSKGLINNNVIALSNNLSTSSERSCTLAEELGHYHTSVGNIIDINNQSNAKQEHIARMWAYNNMIGLIGLVNAYKAGCRDKYDIADYLEVTEEFLDDAISSYTSKYGNYTIIDNFVIYFIPNLGVMELI